MLPRGVVHVASGLYPGPFTLAPGTRVLGEGEVVLTGEGTGVLCEATGGALEGVALQGGAVGLRVRGEVTLARVRLSGQRTQAVVVEGALRLVDATLVASVEGIEGVAATGALTLERVTFQGGFKRAIAAASATVDLTKVSGEGVRTLVHAADSRVRGSELSATGGVGPAVFLAGGDATFSRVYVTGHEYALLAARGARVAVTGLQSTGASEAAVSALQATLSVSDATISRSGGGGAFALMDSTAIITRARVTDGRHLAFFVRHGAAKLVDCRVERLSRDAGTLGDALHARDAKVVLDGFQVVDVEGSALFVTAGSEVRADRLDVERAQSSALFVERGGRVVANAVLVRGGRGPAVLVPDDGFVSIDHLSVAGGDDLPLYAECDLGAHVTVKRLDSTQPQPSSRCVTGPAPPK